MNELINIYDNKLCEALTYSPVYDQGTINLPGIREYILKKEYILKYINFVKRVCNDNNNTLSTEYCRQNILMIINYMRFSYNYQNDKEKQILYKGFNDCICLMNKVSVLDFNVYLNKGKLEMETRHIEEILSTLEFEFIHFFLIDYNKFIEIGLPLFFLKQYWIPCFYSFVGTYPELLNDEEFLRRTQIIIDAVLYPQNYADKEQYNSDLDEYKTEYIKLYKMIYKKTN